MPSTSEAMATALAHHQAGRLPEAEQLYRQILAAEPNHPGAWHSLGIMAYQLGRHDVALRCIGQALALHPNYGEAHSNLGLVYFSQRRMNEAAICYRRALELNPASPEAHYNLGLVLREQGLRDEEVAQYRRALELRPDYADAYTDLGNALVCQGKLDEAIACYRKLLALQPQNAAAHHNLGGALCIQGKYEEAIASHRRALELNPHLAEALNGLAAVYQIVEKCDEAIECYRRALELNPSYVDALNNLGNALKDQAQLPAAIDCYRQAVSISPQFITAQNNLLYALWFCPGIDMAAISEEHRRWNLQHAQPLAASIRPHANDPSPDRRLRIGYVSPDFRNHVQSLFLTPLFAAHDHREFEIFGYSRVASPDEITDRLQKSFDAWRPVTGLSDETVAEMIRRDQIDILVDLTMHMAAGSPLIFARKPAPVQACWLAYPGTTGLTTIDYRLTDPHLDPPGLFERFYSEESVRLPDTFWCYDPLTSDIAVNRLPALEQGHITFGSLNNFCKVNDDVLRLWARVLKAVDRSRLLLLAPLGSPRRRTAEIFEQEGVAPDRITFVGRKVRHGYLENYHQIDIGLDPFPYNGHTTTLDAFWMGVPVVTLVGSTVMGRAGLCQLKNLDLPELIAETPEQYVQIAAELAGDLPHLAELRATLRGRMERSPLMDMQRFARNIEVAYRTMWRRWCDKAGKQ